MASIATEVTRRLLEPTAADDFSRQHLANLVWALATLEYDPGKRSLLALADALVNRADLCNPQEVSNSGERLAVPLCHSRFASSCALNLWHSVACCGATKPR